VTKVKDITGKYSDTFRTPFGASVEDIKAGFHSANATGNDNNAYTLSVPFFETFESGSKRLLSDESYLDALAK
jgi:hypothetical protein